MYQLGKTGLKCLKTIHLVGACCWLGGAFSKLLINIANDAAVSEGMLYGMNTASQAIDVWGIAHMGALVCVLTGLVYGFMSPWKFFRHGWVTAKWGLTLACILCGSVFLDACENEMLELSRAAGDVLNSSAYAAARSKQFSLSLVQIGLLVFTVGLSVFRPSMSRSRKR